MKRIIIIEKFFAQEQNKLVLKYIEICVIQR